MATNADPLRELMSLIKECNELFDKAPDNDQQDIKRTHDMFIEKLIPKLGVSYVNGKWKAINRPNTRSLAKAGGSRGITVIDRLRSLKGNLTILGGELPNQSNKVTV